MSPDRTADSRVTAVERLMPAAALRAEIPAPPKARTTIREARRDIQRILNGKDDRLVLVTGPCSIHDTDAALAYAERLAELSRQMSDRLLIVMRVYVEKPRTRLGWKGLVNDPDMDGSHDVNGGLRMARGLMVEILGTGLPVGCEFLDPMLARYFSDIVSWASIGARTVQSQVHRQLTSGLDMPVGIKNATGGQSIDAIDAIVTAGEGHVFPSLTDEGKAAVVTTSGNPDCHVVLRGGTEGPNYSAPDVAKTLDQLKDAGLPERLVIDASHGNSGKDHEEQANVVGDVADRIAEGEPGVAGMMLESNLACGRQDLILGRTDGLAYGQSVTDACAGWEQTVDMVRRLAEAVTARRATGSSVLVA